MLSPGKSASALLLDIRDSTGTSPLGEAEGTGLCYAGKPVYVLVMVAGPPSAHVHARAQWKQAMGSCWGGDDAELMAAFSWHGASLWWAGRLEGPRWVLPWFITGMCSSPSWQVLEGLWSSFSIHDFPASAGEAWVLIVLSLAVVLGWAGDMQGDGTQSLPGDSGAMAA